MKKFNFKKLFAFGLGLGLMFAPISANAAGVTGYTGNVENTNYGAAAGSGQSASATVELEYNMSDVIAIALTDDSGTFANGTDSIFNGLTSPGASTFLVNKASNIANDIIAIADSAGADFTIRGMLFSSSRSLASVALTVGAGSGDNLTLVNATTSDEIVVGLSGQAGPPGDAVNVVNLAPSLSPAMSSSHFRALDGIAELLIEGDIDESTVTTSDDAGAYTGTLTVTITSL